MVWGGKDLPVLGYALRASGDNMLVICHWKATLWHIDLFERN